MSNLVIDAGYSSLKAAWADGDVLGKCFRYQGDRAAGFIKDITSGQKASTIVVSSSRKTDGELYEELSRNCSRLVVLKENDGIISSVTGGTGGITTDRAAAIIAARHLFNGRPVTVFDFGSIISVDFTDRNGKYLGGNLSLGLRTRYKALNRYSNTLPLIGNGSFSDGIGTSIETSMHSGVNSGIIFEIEGYLRKYPENEVVFTGGDAIYFADKIKTPIFVVCNLVLMGLALIANDYGLNEIV